jgi:preprotein translocase subunit YajC
MHVSLILASGGSGGGGLGILILPLGIGAVMYFLMIRPQRKRMREQQAMQKAIGIGDEVVTNAGIYGFITGEDGDKFWLEIDDDVQIRIARAAIQGKVSPDKDVADDKPSKSEPEALPKADAADSGDGDTPDNS